jgi:RHS repeat-associated protein
MFIMVVSAHSVMAASVTITALDQGNGGVEITANAAFETCANSGNYGNIYVPGLCSKSGNGSASCTAIFDRGQLHGTHTWTATANDCTGSATDSATLTFDNTPTINLTGPSGTVSGSFDITGTVNFKPTNNATKGTINAYDVYGNPNRVGCPCFLATKTCSTESCTFSYKELTGKFYEVPHGGPYTIKLTAYGVGVSTSAQHTFYADNMPEVNVTSPIGTVSGPFDITGTAIFKPTQSSTKGSIAAYLNGNPYPLTSKSCTTESCSFSYYDIYKGLYSLSPGGPYTLKMTAYGGGASASDQQTFYVSDCNIKITDFKGTNAVLDPRSGGSVGISATITEGSGKPVTWTMMVARKAYPGAGSPVEVTWDGRDADDKIVDPGSYKAILIATTEDGKCTDKKDIPFTVIPPPDGQCGLTIVNFGSSAHAASGNLSHSQELFSVRGIGPEPGMSLYYNSLDPVNGSLGLGWSHDYDISLTQNSDDSVLLREGNWRRRLYALSGGTYAAQPQDYSTLVKNPDNTYTITHKNGLKYLFSADGAIASIIDRNDNTLTFTYSGGKLTTVTDSANRTATLTHDGDGHITSVTDPAGKSYTLGYGGGALANVTYPDGGTWSYTYDDKAFLLTKTDPLGAVTTYTYDFSHRIVSATDSSGKTRSINYPTGSETVKTSLYTEKDGGVRQYVYDTEKGTLSGKIDPTGNATSYTYDSSGNMLSKTEPGGKVTSYTYDNAGNMLTTTDPLGNTSTFTYNTFGQVVTATDPNGHTISNTYDVKGNLLQTVDAKGAKTVYTYDGKGHPLTITDPLNKKITYSYDAAGNLISATDQNSKVTTFTYDASGNLLTETNPAGKITKYAYDVMNRLVTITDPLGYCTRFTYDVLGNKLTVTDANGTVTGYTYNHNSQPQTVKDALGAVTTMAYSGGACGSCGGSGNDKLISVTDANNNISRYEYDQNGNLAKEIDPGGIITNYSYDSGGRLDTRTDGNGKTTTYVYDAADRLLSRTYQDGSSDTFTYDAAGNLITASNANISYTLTRDADNRITGITDNNGRTISYALDANGNRTQMTAPDGRITTYAYDAKNRLTQLTDNGNTYAFTYNTLDRRIKLTNPNGTNTTYTYDDNSSITNLVTRKSSGSAINNISHAYDKTANRTTKVEPTGTTNYSYDPIYRLIKSAVGTTTKELFTYDATGNRTTGPTTATAYTIDQGNQLTAYPNVTFTYDNNGNIISKTTLSGTYNYLYDDENRLTELRYNGAAIAIYKYDPFGRRIEKTVSGVTTKYLYDGANILYEYNGSNAIITRYTHNISTDDPLGLETGGKLYAYHKDTLGSIRTITDSTQRTVKNYSYDSFGNMTSLTLFIVDGSSSSTLSQPYAYTGREWDKETGLYYYRARYYDPKIGRFISRDPISFAGGDVNLYGYVSNNPVNWIDPWGFNANVITYPFKCASKFALPNLSGLASFARVANPVGAFSAVFFYDWNTAGLYDDMIPEHMLRVNPNVKGSTPNYKKPKGKSGQCSFEGPGKDPDWNPFLPYLIPFVTQLPNGQKLLNNLPDFIGAHFPGPAAPNYAGGAGALSNALLGLMGCEIK